MRGDGIDERERRPSRRRRCHPDGRLRAAGAAGRHLGRPRVVPGDRGGRPALRARPRSAPGGDAAPGSGGPRHRRPRRRVRDPARRPPPRRRGDRLRGRSRRGIVPARQRGSPRWRQGEGVHAAIHERSGTLAFRAGAGFGPGGSPAPDGRRRRRGASAHRRRVGRGASGDEGRSGEERRRGRGARRRPGRPPDARAASADAPHRGEPTGAPPPRRDGRRAVGGAATGVLRHPLVEDRCVDPRAVRPGSAPGRAPQVGYRRFAVRPRPPLRGALRAAAGRGRDALVARGRSWSRGPGRPPRLQFVVDPGVRVALEAEGGGPRPARATEVVVAVHNDGAAWLSSDFARHPIHLGSRWLDRTRRRVAEGPRVRLDPPVRPGESRRLVVSAAPPPGEASSLQIAPVQEGYA